MTSCSTVIGEELFKDIYRVEKNGVPNIVRPHYNSKTNAYMPVEFSVAAFRYGHSQVRGIYNLNDGIRDRAIFLPGPLQRETQDLRAFAPCQPVGRWTPSSARLRSRAD